MINSNIKPDDWSRTRQALQKLKRKLGPSASPDMASLTLSDLTASRLVASNADKLLISSDLAAWVTGIANQVIVADDEDGTITLSTPQNIHTGASPTFAGADFTEVVTGIIPTIGAHLATKEYVDLAIGASKDYFLSDSDDAIDNYHVLQETDTGEAESTLPSGSMDTGNNQLMFSFITASGVPGVTFLRAGVYVLHTHLARTAGTKPTAFYWTLSKYTTEEVETVLMTSEPSSVIPGTMASFITHASLVSDATIDATDRLVLKLHANVEATGSNSTITIYMEGSNDCHITNLLPSDIWQTQGDVLDDLNTLGAVEADGEFLVGTGAGVLDWESGATARTSLGLGNVSNVATDDTAYNAGTWDSNTDATTKNAIRDKVETMDTAIGLNTAKNTNVSTNLSLGAITATTMIVASSDGTDATLIEADTNDAGLLGSDKWDEIVTNSAHAADNSQAHTDYLINNGADSTSGVLTAAGFTVGSMALTNGVITDATGLSIMAATSITGDLTVGTSAFHVDAADGYIGIGLATPGVLLHIQTSAVDGADYDVADQIVLERNGNANMNIITGPTNRGGLYFSDFSRARGQIVYDHSVPSMIFAVEQSAKMTILNNGNIGIGTITPDAKLQVNGNIWPETDNANYLGKNDDDAPKAWKGVILKDTTNGKYYRIEIINGTVTATDLTD